MNTVYPVGLYRVVLGWRWRGARVGRVVLPEQIIAFILPLSNFYNLASEELTRVVTVEHQTELVPTYIKK